MIKKLLKDKYFWSISLLILIITFFHYSNITTEWELHNFYRKLYYIPVIFAAFKFRLIGGMIASIIVSILYAPHIIWFSSGLNIGLINQYLEILLFIIIGFITGWLVEEDYKKQSLLENNIKEITRLQNYTNNVINSIEGGVLATNNSLVITSLNRGGERILGLEDALGINISTIFDENVIDILNQTKLQGFMFSDIKANIKVDGEEKYLRLTISPLFNIVDKIQGIVIVIHDYSNEKYLESQNTRVDRLSAIGELAAGIAHEIRNPMAIIKTISQTLQNEYDQESISEGLTIIIEEIDRANKVIQSLLNFAKPDVNKVERIKLNALLDEVLIIINKFAINKNIDINVQLDKESIILGDREKLKQVFINIILNSIQSMDNGGLIIITTKLSDLGVNISFRDNGMGVAKENLNKIFNPFFTTKEHGTGLGLSVSSRIIQDHDGYITIDSNINEGTLVVVYLPNKRE